MGRYDDMTREEIIAEQDPYNPDPEALEYLDETDTSCTNEELGRDENGEPE